MINLFNIFKKTVIKNQNHSFQRKVYCKELELLRSELKELKSCQLKYFTLSITTTAIILGVVSRLGTDNTVPVPNIFYLLPLAPLAILFPSWFVFFDKAKTITRIVAYYRLLESLIIGNISFKFIGWENSVALFRKKELELKKEAYVKKYKKSFFFKPVGNYWTIIFFSFMLISFLCVVATILSMYSSQKFGFLSFWFIILSTLAVFLFACYKNWIIYKQLVVGIHSYDANQRFWEEILEVKDILG